VIRPPCSYVEYFSQGGPLFTLLSPLNEALPCNTFYLCFSFKLVLLSFVPEYVHSTHTVLTSNLCDYYRFSDHVDTFRRD